MPFAVFNAWKPFGVSDPARHAGRDENLKRISSEVAAARAAECTFKPATLAARPGTPAAALVGKLAAAPPPASPARSRSERAASAAAAEELAAEEAAA